MVNDYLIVQGWSDPNEDHEIHVTRCLNMIK